MRSTDFHAAFASALLAPDPRAAASGLAASVTSQPGFAVYRNTAIKGCIDALQSSFPSVARLVGEEWFRAAAAVFVHDSPPHTPVLLDYGADFADFLQSFPPAREIPYLADVARVDRMWSEAHVAADEQALETRWLAAQPPQEMAALTVRPLAATRWRWFDDAPIYTIRAIDAATDAAADEAPAGRAPGRAERALEIDWRGEGVLVTRPGHTVQVLRLGRGGCAFLDHCASGAPLAHAAQAAVQAEPDLDLAALTAHLLASGALGAAAVAGAAAPTSTTATKARPGFERPRG